VRSRLRHELGQGKLNPANQTPFQVREATEYRRKVYSLVRALIQSSAVLGQAPVTWHSPEWAVFMGCEHERIHIETTSVLIRELPISLVKAPPSVRPSLQLSTGPVRVYSVLGISVQTILDLKGTLE
jgi:hypothetical protein